MATNTNLLNKATPGTKRAALGDVLSDFIDEHNALVTKFNALLAKLDDDATVTDTDYEATLAGTASTTLDAR